MLILDQHRHDLPALGMIDVQRDRLAIRFNKPITRNQFFATFGNVGFIVTESDGKKIRAAEILEFSLSSNP